MKSLIFQWRQSNLQDKVFGLLVLLFFVLPLSIPLSGWLFVVTLLCAFVDQYQRRNEVRKKVLPTKLQYLLYALIALSIFSLSQSGDPFASAYNYFYVVGQYIGGFWLVLRYAVRDKRPLIILKAMLISAAIVAAYGIIQYVVGAAVLDVEWVDTTQFPELKKRAYSTLQNPNILGSFLVWTIAYCIGVFSALPGGKRRIALICFFSLSFACLLLTYSRGNWVSMAIMLFIFAVFFYNKAVLPFLGGGALVAYFAWDMLSNRLLSIFSTEDTSVALRFAYIESTVAMIKENPLGVGWYGYMFAFPDYDFYLQNPDVPMYHCHNLYLNIAAELGVHGLILFLLVVAYLMKSAWFLSRADVEPWRKGIGRGYLMAIIGIAVSGLTDHTLFNVQLGMLFWLMSAVLMVCAFVAKENLGKP